MLYRSMKSSQTLGMIEFHGGGGSQFKLLQSFRTDSVKSNIEKEELIRLLDSQTTPELPRHPEFNSGSINVGRSPRIKSELIDSGSESGMTLSREEIAQGVDSCETVPVPLRDDMVFSLSPRERGRGEGATLKNSEANVLPEKSLPCQRGGQSPHLDSEPMQSIKSQPKLDRLRWRDLQEKSPLLFPPLARGANAAAKAAFTLAEVLITLSIIGIVAALTIPNLIQNHNQKAWDTAADVFQKKLEVAARSMNTQEVLAGYTTTKAFVNELKKHIKITHICDNNELDKCFPKKVYWGAEQEEVEISDITSAKNFGQDDWGTEVIGVEFANGIDALIAYDPNCTQDPYNNQIQASNCMAILYDTSARKNPNSYGKDLRANGNVKSLGGITCAFKVGDTCYTNPILPSPMTKAECEAEKDKLGIEACYYDDDYWAGAVKHCGGVNKLPSPSQLAAIATDLYGEHGFGTGEDEYIDGLNMDKTKDYVSILDTVYGDSVSGRPTGEFALWSGQESGERNAYVRGFYSDYTYAHSTSRYNDNGLAVCVGD